MTWQYASLGDLVAIKGGGTPSRNVESYWNGGIPWATVKDFKSDVILTTEENISGLGVEESATNVIPKGTIIIPTRMALGKVAIAGTDLAINQDIKALALKNKKSITTDFLFWFLRSSADDFERAGKGATVKGITIDFLKSVQVPLPPLETQKHIARVLELADQLRKQAQQMESELSQLAQSLFLEMFGDPVKAAGKWKTLSLKSISKKFNDGPFGSNLKSEHYVDNGVRVIRLQNIAAGAFVDKDKAYISEEHAESLNKFWCKAGDIVIATLGDPNLRACIIPEEIPLAMNKADCVHCVPNPDIVETEWLMCYLNLPQTLSIIANDLHGQTRTRISSGQLAKLQVPIPPLKEQKLFTERMAQIRDIQETSEQQKAKIEESFESLMQRAFKGELTAPGSKAA